MTTRVMSSVDPSCAAACASARATVSQSALGSAAFSTSATCRNGEGARDKAQELRRVGMRVGSGVAVGVGISGRDGGAARGMN